MARGLNKVLLIGNLGADPEIKYAPSGTAIATFNMATTENRKNRDGEWEDQTEWHRVVMFGKQAEFCKDYLHKGSKLFVEGRLQTRSWDDQSGQKKYMTEVVGNQMLMLDSRESGGGGGGDDDEGRSGGQSGQEQGKGRSGGGKGGQGGQKSGQSGQQRGGGRRSGPPPEDAPDIDEDLPF